MSAGVLPTNASGFTQAIDTDKIVRVAIKLDIMVELKYRPGDYVVEVRAIAPVSPRVPDRHDVAADINSTLMLGPARTPIQVRFGFDQIVETALVAMSSGVTDPHAALNCIDLLTSGMCRIAGRDSPSPYRYDDSGNVRLISTPFQLPGVVHTAFGQLRHYRSAP